MANSIKIGSIAVCEDQQTEAAIQALERFQTSTEDFLKYRHIYANAAETGMALAECQSRTREKDNTIQELESAISVFTHEGNKQVSRMKLEMLEMDNSISDLKRQLQHVTEEKTSMAAQVEEAERLLVQRGKDSAKFQKEAIASRATENNIAAKLENQLDIHDDLLRRLDIANRQLIVYNGYTANLVDLNIKSFSKRIAKIWDHTNTLARKYFSADLPSELLESHDQWVQQASTLVHPPSGNILIPPTNSTAAKYARQAVMLNLLAQTLTTYVFSATPLPLAQAGPAQAGLNDIFSKLMDQDANKERLLRALLLSGSTQEPLRVQDIQSLAKWFVKAFGILSTSKARTEMKMDLEKFMEEAANCWSEAHQSHHKVIATFDYESYRDSFKSFPAPKHQLKQSAKHSQSSDPDNDDEVSFFAFPAIMAIGDGIEDIIHPGVLVHYAHIQVAEEEWRKEQKRGDSLVVVFPLVLSVRPRFESSLLRVYNVESSLSRYCCIFEPRSPN